MNVVPWTAFNNTVVLGSALIGLAAFLPVYGITRPIFARFTEKWAEHVKKYRVVQIIGRGEMADRLVA
jgi:hypothetical protein